MGTDSARHGLSRVARTSLCATLLVLLGASVLRGAAPKYILFLTADGFRSDYIERLQPPQLSALIADGARVTRVTNVFPTVTTPNMASIATGGNSDRVRPLHVNSTPDRPTPSAFVR